MSIGEVHDTGEHLDLLNRLRRHMDPAALTGGIVQGDARELTAPPDEERWRAISRVITLAWESRHLDKKHIVTLGILRSQPVTPPAPGVFVPKPDQLPPEAITQLHPLTPREKADMVGYAAVRLNQIYTLPVRTPGQAFEGNPAPSLPAANKGFSVNPRYPTIGRVRVSATHPAATGGEWRTESAWDFPQHRSPDNPPRHSLGETTQVINSPAFSRRPQVVHDPDATVILVQRDYDQPPPLAAGLRVGALPRTPMPPEEPKPTTSSVRPYVLRHLNNLKP